MKVLQPPSNEMQYCWEQILRINPLFRITLVFAQPGEASGLLPLYALFAAVEEACSVYSDEAVARRKLDWWREECRHFPLRGSDHPILREMQHCGAAVDWSIEHLDALFDSAESRIDAGPVVDFADLRRVCEGTGLPQLRLEATLAGSGTTAEQAIEGRAASIGLAQLLRESQRKPGAGAWHWLPLSLLARHGLTGAEVAAAPDASVAQPLFNQWLSEISAWLPEAKGSADGPGAAQAGSRHMHVVGELQARRLRQLQHLSPSRYGAALTRVGPAELYQAWRAARRFSRR